MNMARRVAALAVLIFGVTFTLRVQGISDHFWLLEDQIRDWSIALSSFSELPLVGSPTHFDGYTIGPAFYWILWAIRITLGPWFQNLPHAGGIGQAMLQSGADALLVVAIWRRTRSPWIALSTGVMVATAAYDLALSALVWNPTMGSVLARVAMALVLLGWHDGSTIRIASTTAVAWSAVHAYTGAIFVAVSVFVAILADPIIRRNWMDVRRVGGVVVMTVSLLQTPYMMHRLSEQFIDPAMGGVSDSVGRILSGRAQPAIANSVAGYVDAVHFIAIEPWRVPFVGWMLVVCAGIVAVRYRRDRSLLAMTLLPQGAAIAGYSLFLGDLNHYYYLSLMPAVTLMFVLAATALPPPRLVGPIAVTLLVLALATVPGRLSFAATMHQMPQYRLLVDGSRQIKSVGRPVRAIETDFALPRTADPEFLYTVLGGHLDSRSPWTALITTDGRVTYRNVGDRDVGF